MWASLFPIKYHNKFIKYVFNNLVGFTGNSSFGDTTLNVLVPTY